jgi:hypothetical protein
MEIITLKPVLEKTRKTSLIRLVSKKTHVMK